MMYTIPIIPPSLNKFAGRKNCWEYREIKKEWLGIVAIYCRPKPIKPYAKAVVELTYFFPNRIRRDPDNYSGKMILDGLTKSGIITDDSFSCIELVLKGYVDKKSPRVEVRVTEVEE